MDIPYNYNNELRGKIALVTGGTKGTGKAIAERLKNAGATVIISARNEPEIPENSFYFIASDLNKSEGTEKVINEILNENNLPLLPVELPVNNLAAPATPAARI